MTPRDFSLLVMTWGHNPAPAEDFVEVARHAERAGLYSVGLPHVPVLSRAGRGSAIGRRRIPIVEVNRPDYYVDPMVLLPMMAAATTTLRVGLNVMITPTFHPFLAAKYLATLDAASRGRLVAGFGAGFAPTGGICESLDYLGIDSAKRGAMADEALSDIVALWTATDPISFQGQFYGGTELVVDPKPAQRPYPELWWAGESKAAIRRAGRYANSLELEFVRPEAVRDDFIPALEAECELHGRSAQVSLLLLMMVTEKPLTPAQISERYWGWKLDDVGLLAAGSPEQCAEVIAGYRAAGVSHFVLDLHRHGFDAVSSIHDQLAMFCEEVVPMLSTATVPQP